MVSGKRPTTCRRAPAAPSPASPAPGAAGYALITALVTLVLVLAAAALVALDLTQRQQRLRDAARGVHLTAISDAGVALALARLSIDPAWEGQPESPLDGGTLEVRVTGDGTPRGRRVIVHARYRGGRRAVEADVLLPPYDPPRVRAWRRLPAVSVPPGGPTPAPPLWRGE